jgi:nitrite reductase (NO-forming)
MGNEAQVPAKTAERGWYEWWLTPVTAGLAVMALTIALVAVLISGTKDPASSEGSSPGAETSFDIELTEFAITPATVTAAPGQPLTFHVTNKGTMPHDFSVNGTEGTTLLDPGASATLEVKALDATTQAWCTVSGHKEAGMVMTIDVPGTAAPGAAAAGAGAPSAAKAIDPKAMPSSGWKPYDPTLKPAPGGKDHKITLHATEKVIEIAPGVKQEMWTFNDTVPGPVLHGKVGDTFTVTLINDGKVGHSIDFHASQVAMDTKMRTIQPGESLVYQFTAEHSGIWMYHCGTAPVLHHIGNGMYGAVVIDPPNLKPVDHEYVFVQSELYLSPDGKVAGMDKMLSEQWDGVVWNGYYNQYSFKPITTAKPGERVRIWVLDAGPSENTAFHIVGTQFDTVFKEGAYLLRPGNAEQGGSQTMDLQPSQGGFVELAFPEDGTFAMVTHKFASASKGAVAIWHVGTVPEAPGGSAGH